jgi:hypothetical protein
MYKGGTGTVMGYISHLKYVDNVPLERKQFSFPYRKKEPVKSV